MKVPDVPGRVPLFGNLIAMRTAPLDTLMRTLRECGDLARAKFPGTWGTFCFTPIMCAPCWSTTPNT